MTSRHFDGTIAHLASRLTAEHQTLARAWLDRLDALLQVERQHVFPSPQLLDHVPDLLREIAVYLRAPADQEIAANTQVMAKAAELGVLRFDQRASVHQLLREYQMLAEVLETFFAREIAILGDDAHATAAVLAVARAQQAVRELQRRTVDAFIARYAATIERQHDQLAGFGRLVSHEIRQPLGVLQVLSRLLATPDANDRQRLVDALERNVLRLADVTGKLEKLARLTRRTQAPPNDQAVELAPLVRDIAGQLSDMAELRGVRIEIADGLPTLVTDAGRLELVFVNLLANAIKYSDPAKSDRLVRVEPGDGSGHVVHVVDNGIGIPEGRLALIFEQFVRVHAHLDDELGAQGLGLGLSIVRECMDAMGGTVSVRSVDGEGTTFVLMWAPPPAAVEPAAQA